jgi:hypothetical protein
MTLEGRIVMRKGKIVEWKIPCQISRIGNGDGGHAYVADCSMLRIASHGKTKAEAERSMNAMVQTFLDELLDMGTFDEVMKEYGWQKTPGRNKAEPTEKWITPVTTTAYAMAGSSA